jgi:hypothetical protein
MEYKWTEFMAEGDAYLKTGTGGALRPKVFSPEILYNVLAMAMEKHIMAVLIFKETLADNHTFTDLINSCKTVCPIPGSIAMRMLDLESYQNICPVFDGYNREPFPVEKVQGMIDVAGSVQTWAKAQIAA